MTKRKQNEVNSQVVVVKYRHRENGPWTTCIVPLLRYITIVMSVLNQMSTNG